MSKDEISPSMSKAITVFAFGIGVVAVIGGGLLLQEHGPGNMGTGFLQGGAISMVIVGILLWRAHVKSDRASTFERAFTQTGDERDDVILTRAFAVLGACAVPITALATVIIALGANTSMVLTLLLVAQALIGTVAFVAINRRNLGQR